MGLSEWRRMRQLEREAVDIRETLRAGRMSPDGAKHLMKHERDETGRKNYRKVRGNGGKKVLSAAEERALIKKAKQAESELKKAKKEAKKNK